MAQPKKILIVCGEPSGDLHASNLVKDIKSLDSSVSFFGMGGELCKKAGVDTVFDISDLALVGLVEVLKNIFTVGKAYSAVLKAADAEKPDLAILVDYPGFNLRIARALSRKSIPVVYYISPQVWAWGRDRIDIIKKCVKKILVLFKFEEELYKTYDVDVEFVGHPLVDTVKPSRTKEETLKKYGIKPGEKVIALLPGSRKIEISRLLPAMLGAAGMIDKKIDTCRFIVSKHSSISKELYDSFINAGSGTDPKPVNIDLIEGDVYNLLSSADFAVVASGTATLETAIIGLPHIIVYSTNPVTAYIARAIMKVDHLGIANIIAGRRIVPELWQEEVTPENISKLVLDLLSDKTKLSAAKSDLAAVKTSLGSSGASLRAARSVLSLLS